MRQAILIAGLGYGDEGKGTTVDFLADKFKSPLVVRYNGGAQAAHNVVVDSTHHTFAQFGSGTFAGAATLLSQYMLVNPVTALSEGAALQKLGLQPFEKLFVHQDAVVTTPFHVATNRLNEMLRSPNRKHGSCGMGIGDTREDELVHPEETVRIKDLANESILLDKLTAQQSRKAFRLSHAKRFGENNEHAKREFDVLNHPEWVARTMDYFQRFYRSVNVVDSEFLQEYLAKDETIIFEGAQGVLLDQDYGFQPHTTWTSTTFKNALALLEGSDIPTKRIGITRIYATRHGAGPLMGEHAAMTEWVGRTDHNKMGDYQGSFRAAPFDVLAMNYALEVLGPVDGIMVTHVDQHERYYFPSIGGYRGRKKYFSEMFFGFGGEVIHKIIPPSATDIKDINRTYSRQVDLMNELRMLQPIVNQTPPGAVDMANYITAATSTRLAGTSFGQGRAYKEWNLPE